MDTNPTDRLVALEDLHNVAPWDDDLLKDIGFVGRPGCVPTMIHHPFGVEVEENAVPGFKGVHLLRDGRR